MSKIFFSEIVRDLYILQYRDYETKFLKASGVSLRESHTIPIY